MNKILLASHGPLAGAMKTTAEFILGRNDNVYSICAYVDEESKNLPKIVDQWMQRKQPEDTWVVLTDVFGGSVNNEFMIRLKNNDFYLVAGMSLPLLISLVTDAENLNEKQIKTVVAEMNDMILYCNDLLEKDNVKIDEEF